MPANTAPIFTLTPNTVPVFLAAANTASDGSGVLSTLVTAAADGTLVEAVTFRNAQITQAASSAMLGKIFLSDAAGTNFQLVGEVLIPAVTRSATVIGATATHTFVPALKMKSGQLLSVCQSVYAGAQDRNSVIAFAANY